MSIQWSGYNGVALFSGIVSLFLAYWVWRRRPATAAIAAAGLISSIALRDLGYAWQLIAVSLEDKLLGLKIFQTGFAIIPIAWAIFVIHFTGRSQHVSRRQIALVALIPLMTLAAAWTVEHHNWLYTDIHLYTTGSLTWLDLSFGKLFWIHLIYSFVLFIAGAGMILRLTPAKQVIFFHQRVIILICASLLASADLISASPLNPLAPFNLGPAISGLAVIGTAGWLSRYQLLDLSPITPKSLFKAMQDGIIVLDRRARIVSINPSGADFLGVGEEDVRGRSLEELGLDFDGSKLSENSAQHEIGCPHCDRVVDLHATPILDHTGHLAGHILILHDISSLKQMERKLFTTNQLLESVFDNTHLMVAFLDAEFNFLRVNQAYAQADERQPEFFPGKNHFDLYPHAENQVIFQRVVESGEAHFELAKPFEYVEHPERGESFWDWSLIPILEQGRVTGLILSVLDVSERVLADARWQAQQDKMLSIFRAAPVGIGVVENRVIVEGNERLFEITGYSREELLGKDARMLYLSDEDYEFVGREKYRQIEEGGTGRVETRFKHKTGHIINILLSSTPLDPANLSAGVTFTALDISDRVRAEAQVQQRAHFLELLHTITRAALQATEFNEMLQVLADRLGELIHADGCYITLWDDAQQLARPAAAYGPLRDSYVQNTSVKPGEVTMTESVLKAGHALVAEDVMNSPYITPRIAAPLPARSMLGVPLIAGDIKLGAALIVFNKPHHITADEIALGEQAGGQIALAMAKVLFYEEIQRHAATLEERVEEKSTDLNIVLGAAVEREVRMSGLKEAIRQLRVQLRQAGLEPMANDPFLE